MFSLVLMCVCLSLRDDNHWENEISPVFCLLMVGRSNLIISTNNRRGFSVPTWLTDIRRVAACFNVPVVIMNMDMVISHQMKCARVALFHGPGSITIWREMLTSHKQPNNSPRSQMELRDILQCSHTEEDLDIYTLWLTSTERDGPFSKPHFPLWCFIKSEQFDGQLVQSLISQ